MATIGPGHEETALSFLHREIRYVANAGYSWHPNPRHIDEVVAELNLEQAEPVAAPAVKDGGPAVREADDALDTATVAVYVRCTGKLIYLSQDRFDTMYVVRLLASALKSPTVRDWLRLEHLAKYLAGTRDWAIEYRFQGVMREVVGYSDSDWATCQVTRHSVSSGLLL